MKTYDKPIIKSRELVYSFVYFIFSLMLLYTIHSYQFKKEYELVILIVVSLINGVYAHKSQKMKDRCLNPVGMSIYLITIALCTFYLFDLRYAPIYIFNILLFSY